MPTVNLTAPFQEFGSLHNTVPAQVFTRARWSDPWVESPYLRCNWAQWTIQPGYSQAELQWNYGKATPFDVREWQLLLPDPGTRRYVKILWDNQINLIEDATPKPITWYGIISGVGIAQGGVLTESIDGVDTDFETGAQSLHCIGLEKLLEDTLVLNSSWTDDDGELFRIDRGLTFNDYRADGSIGGNMSGAGRFFEGVPVFSNKIIDDDLFWTSSFILKYLLKFHRPADRNGIPIPFAAAGLETYLVNRDRPHLETHGRNVRELLNQLFAAERFTTWTLEVDETFNAIFIRIINLNGDVLLLPSVDVLLANPRRWTFSIDDARTTSALTLSHADAVERVRVQGARGTSTFSLSYADGTLEKGWTDSQQVAYNLGATFDPTYAGSTKALKRKLNKLVRQRDDCKFVYCRHKVAESFDGFVGDGEGGVPHSFCPIETETPRFKFNPREFEIEPYTALRDGFYYNDLGGSAPGAGSPPSKAADGPHNHRPPLAFMRWPATGQHATALAAKPRWHFVESIAHLADEDHVPGDAELGWSANVEVPKKDRSVCLKIHSEPQWIVAGSQYSDAQRSQCCEELKDKWDYETLIVTVTAKWDAFCEGVWPPTKLDLSTNDHIREAVFNAGDEYRLDWLVPRTVIGIIVSGGLNHSALGGWIQDDRAKLRDRARLAFAWYGIERRAMQVSTAKLNGSIRLGDYVVNTGSLIPKTVNTVITSIRIDCPPGELGGEGPLPVQTYTTDWIPGVEMFLSPNLAPSMKPAAAPAAAAAAGGRSWETEVPKGPVPEPQPGEFGEFMDPLGRVWGRPADPSALQNFRSLADWGMGGRS